MKPEIPKGPTRSLSGSTTRYITAAGYNRLIAELQRLWKIDRPKVTQEVSDAAALGDRSENAEYLYGKKKLREIDRRVRFLQKRIDELEVVQPSAEQAGRVFFGAFVTVESEDEETMRFQIVGPDEFDLKENRISIDSPMARALIGRRVDDEVLLQRPKGRTHVTIIDISYSEK